MQGLRGGVVLVSHDREFLARCVTRVLELDLAQGTNRVYGGGYDAYLEERATLRRHAREQYEEFADKKADLVARARTQREWSSQGVRNAMRKSPDNDKIRRTAMTESSEKQAQKVRQMESRIARLEEVEEPRKEWQLQFTIGAAPRSSTVVATLSSAVARQGDFTLGPVSLAPPKLGTVVRIIEFPPAGLELRDVDADAAKQAFSMFGGQHALTAQGGGKQRHPFMHRTETIDYAIVLSGEITMLLDESEVTLGAGEVLIQRGTNHAWTNRTNEPARVLFVLVDGKFDPALPVQQ